MLTYNYWYVWKNYNSSFIENSSYNNNNNINKININQSKVFLKTIGIFFSICVGYYIFDQ